MATPTQTLDIRAVPPREKHPTIFGLFDGLAVGQGFQLINDHDPVPLYCQFQVQRAGLFDWEKVEEGPEVWKVNIFRR